MSNITLNAGSGGATLGTDTVTGTPNVDYQIVKIGFSAAGSTPVQVQTGNPLPVVQTGAMPAGSNVIGTINLGTLNGAATAVKQPALGTAGSASADVITVQGIASMTALKVDGSAVTQPVSAVSLPLPTGAATSAKQPALGTAGSASADVLTIQGIASMTKLLVTPDSVALPANQSVNVSQINGVTPLMGNGTTGTGSLRVTISSDNTAFSVNAVQSGTWTVQPGNTANTTPWLVTDTPATSGGLSFSYTLSAASNNLTQAKGTAGQLFTVVVTNTNVAARYLKIFNKASASVTMGTTAADFQFVIPGNTAGAGLAINIDKGISLGTGITYAITAGVSLTDNTSVAANEVSALLGYK